MIEMITHDTTIHKNINTWQLTNSGRTDNMDIINVNILHTIYQTIKNETKHTYYNTWYQMTYYNTRYTKVDGITYQELLMMSQYK